MNHTFSSNPYDDAEELSTKVFDYLYSAYLLTEDPQYYNKMLEYGRKLIAYNIDDKQLFKENFFSAAVVNTISTIYDVCQESLNETEKKDN